MAAKSTRKFLLAASCAAVLSLMACTMVTTRKSGTVMMSGEEFEKYVENVFRYHNQVMNDLIEASDDRSDQDTEEAKALSAAEARMIETCQPLNEVVSEALSGKSLGLSDEMGLADAVPACEEASQVVDELIP